MAPSPPKQILLEYKLHGLEDPKAPTMICMAGWPDTGDLFLSNAVPTFEKDFRIVTMNMPGITRESFAQRPRFLGWTFTEMGDLFIATVEHVMAGDQSGLKPVCVAHDWASFVLSEALLKKPDMFRRLVVLDVGGQVCGDMEGTIVGALINQKLSMPIGKALSVVFYQTPIMLAYFLPGILGTLVTYTVLYLLSGPTWYRRNPGPLQGMHGGMSYPYLQFWKASLSGNLIPFMRQFNAPKPPTFFGYGRQQPLPMWFHTDTYVNHLNQRKDGSRAIGYEAGHWFFDPIVWPEPGKKAMADVRAFVMAGQR